VKEEVLIIDIPTSNVGSIRNVILELGYPVIVSSELDDLKKSKKVILPGHGTFNATKKFLIEKKIFNYLKYIPENKFLLGICVGMQLLGNFSYEEEKSEGLDLINGEVKKIDCKNLEKLPHIGWNQLELKNEKSSLLNDVNFSEENNVYFSHSYNFNLENLDYLVCLTPYGQNGVASIIQRDKIFGLQFHPEKSSFLGKKILKNFLDLKC
tara:strand:- start:524 stop:1153 length:630 start_codon:yes stop_codon:yes gene_type:complete